MLSLNWNLFGQIFLKAKAPLSSMELEIQDIMHFLAGGHYFATFEDIV